MKPTVRALAARAVTGRDCATIEAFAAALAIAVEQADAIMREIAVAGSAITPTLRQIARAAALVEVFDAQPRHREVPPRDDVIEWLGRHCGEPGDPWRPDMAPDGPPEWLDRPGAAGRYSYTQGG